MIAIAPTTRIFVYTTATDMRKGFCGLSRLVKEHFDIDLFSGHLFVFSNRRRDYVKILACDNDGLSIWSTQFITNKFADNLPLYRGEDIFARAGKMIPQNTQFGMLVIIQAMVASLLTLMRSRVVSGSGGLQYSVPAF